MITGRPLLGEHVWRTGPVAIVTYEDDEIEWRRRIAAACLHYEIHYEDVIGSFYLITRPGARVRFATRGTRDAIEFPDGDAIVRHLIEIGAVLLIIDPFNHTHDIEDGNNNALIARVAAEIGRIARESSAAVLLLHHLRKASTGSTDDFMGATSLRATLRSVRILARMSGDLAEKMGLPRNQAWRYSCIAATKGNYAPPLGIAIWYRLEGVKLGKQQRPLSRGR
jgi:RecA-family ATPase